MSQLPGLPGHRVDTALLIFLGLVEQWQQDAAVEQQMTTVYDGFSEAVEKTLVRILPTPSHHLSFSPPLAPISNEFP